METQISKWGTLGAVISLGIAAVVALPEAVPDNLDEFLRLNRLIQILCCPGIHGFQICVNLTIGGENDNGDFVSSATNGLEEV